LVASAPVRRGQYGRLDDENHVEAVGHRQPLFGFAMDDAQADERVKVYVANRET
jgi:hypothetical protein